MSYIGADADLSDPRFGNVWRDEITGAVYGTVRLAAGSTITITFYSPADARAVAAACTETAEAMDRLAAEMDRPPDTDVFPLDIALGHEGEPSWCVLAEDGDRADCDSRGEAYGTAAEITGTGRRAAVYVRSASRYCFARYEVVEPADDDETAPAAGGD